MDDDCSVDADVEAALRRFNAVFLPAGLSEGPSALAIPVQAGGRDSFIEELIDLFIELRGLKFLPDSTHHSWARAFDLLINKVRPKEAVPLLPQTLRLLPQEYEWHWKKIWLSPGHPGFQNALLERAQLLALEQKQALERSPLPDQGQNDLVRRMINDDSNPTGA